LECISTFVTVWLTLTMPEINLLDLKSPLVGKIRRASKVSHLGIRKEHTSIHLTLERIRSGILSNFMQC
jgi:hypothetical protein